MKTAFEIMGIPCWHWISMAENPPDMLMWQEALEAKFDPNSTGTKRFGRQEFDKLLGHWGATTDLPAALFAEELIDAYPDAKVILIERDVEKWYKSFSETVVAGLEAPLVSLAEKMNPTFLGQMAHLNDLITRYGFHVAQPRAQWLINNPEHFKAWRANAKDTYLSHNEMVKRVTPKDKLLLFTLEDGWEPLCRFLGKPVPTAPFPRVNETAALQEKMKLYVVEAFRRSAMVWVRQLLPVALAIAAMIIWWMQT
jgi:hypothetical protein